MQKRILIYIEHFNEVFNGDPWVDETFSKKLDGLSEEAAFTQSPGSNHSAAEVVSHIIVWRYEILRRLHANSEISQLADDGPDNWKDWVLLKETGWQKLHQQFNQSHEQVIKFLQDKNDTYLDEPLGNSGRNKEYLVAGLLQHDLYHLGQIGLILKWAK